MSALTKAELCEISSGNNPHTVGTADVVQFNPSTLRVQISNRTAGGQQAGAQARQRPGTGEMQVSFDLVFDSADEGSDVLKKTAVVERYVRPRSSKPGDEAPPRVQFKWGTFMVQGTMESANLDLDLFSADGMPLRAKVAVTIKGQDPRWAYQASQGQGGAAAAQPGNAGNVVNNSPQPAGTPGTSGSSQAAERVVQAMPGESLAQLAARNGLDPSAWRALSSGAGDPLKLAAGQEVALPSSASGGAASGQRAQGSSPAQTTSRMPLLEGASASSRSSAVAMNPLHGGQAIVSQGGMSSAIAQLKNQGHQNAADRSLAAFGLGGASVGDASDRPWGAGVPLRPRFGGGKALAQRDPAQPGWLSAPTAQPARGTAASVPASKKAMAGQPCGCGQRSQTLLATGKN